MIFCARDSSPDTPLPAATTISDRFYMSRIRIFTRLYLLEPQLFPNLLMFDSVLSSVHVASSSARLYVTFTMLPLSNVTLFPLLSLSKPKDLPFHFFAYSMTRSSIYAQIPTRGTCLGRCVIVMELARCSCPCHIAFRKQRLASL